MPKIKNKKTGKIVSIAKKTKPTKKILRDRYGKYA